MSIAIKILVSFIAFSILPLHKEKDKCLIIYLHDNRNSYEITNLKNSYVLYYLNLKFPNSLKNNNKVRNPAIQTGVTKYPTSVTYNLQNKEEIDNLPDYISPCQCASVEKFNLDMEFKLFVERNNGWISFDAKKILVEE